MHFESTRAPAVSPLIRWALYALMASLPFEYPGRSIPVEIPTLFGSIFLLTTLLQPRLCYATVPWAVVWFAVYLCAFLLSVGVGAGDYAGEVLKLFLNTVQGVLLLWVGYNLLCTEAIAKRALTALVIACALRAALPLLGIAKSSVVVYTGGERVTALGQNANNSAMVLSAGLIALIGLAYTRTPRAVRPGLLVWLLTGLLGFAIVDTGSRGGLAAAAVGVLVFGWARGPLRTRLRHGIISLVAIGLLGTAAFSLPVMRHRLEQSARTGDMAGRERIYPALLTMVREQPVLGWGPIVNRYELAGRIGERVRPWRGAHNFILEVLTASGLVGAIPFLVGTWLCAQGAWRARAGVQGILPLALLSTLLVANTSGDWIASKHFWLVLAYALASGTWLAMRTAPRIGAAEAEPSPIRAADRPRSRAPRVAAY
jgi:O-antigen ligase